mgnify:CR=1 FL=1
MTNNKLTSNPNTITFYAKKNFFHFYRFQLSHYIWLHECSKESRGRMLNNKAEEKLEICVKED